MNEGMGTGLVVLIFYSFYLVCGRGSVGAHKIDVARVGGEEEDAPQCESRGETWEGGKESGLLRGAHGSCCIGCVWVWLGDVFNLWRGGGPTEEEEKEREMAVNHF